MTAHTDPERQPASRSEQPPAILAGIVATGLAATVGAILTSYLGVQGTLTGAALGAMLAASISQVVRVPLGRLERRLVQAGFSAVRLRHLGLVRGVLSTHGAPVKLWRAIPRQAVLATLGVAVVGFGLGMAGLTLLEASQNRPVSAITTGAPQRGTTASNLVSRGNPAPEPADQAPTPEAGATERPETASPVPGTPGTATPTGGAATPTGPAATATAGLLTPTSRPTATTPTPGGATPTPAATAGRATETATRAAIAPAGVAVTPVGQAPAPTVPAATPVPVARTPTAPAGPAPTAPSAPAPTSPPASTPAAPAAATPTSSSRG